MNGNFNSNGPTHVLLQRQSKGMTLIELMIVIAIIGILTSVAISSYSDYLERLRVKQAIMDISSMSAKINQYFMDSGDFPATLAEVGGYANDPWGKPYVYVNLTAVHGRGKARKDRKLNPLNSDYDLYSLGKDGVTKPQITNRDSLDDVLRASDGAFIDLASKF
ncbi:MAG: prepilin-type N-terminal cleavage/methylation domain-containing protein [Burkholderiaceae bacterium]